MDQQYPKPVRKPIRAAQYVRMSTEHQQYSTENQSDAIARYAEQHGMEIVVTHADSGKSGLTLAGREELQKLLEEAESGNADFSAVLVYDVSRWGRFQDVDESAYHEYVCRRAGVNVHYCAEQFENDGSPISNLIKSVKRTMAGEYSRELSVKVFAGQCRLIELGYRQGGPAGYGLRRQLVAMDGTPKELLSRGQQKSIQTDRVILVPGPADELQVVREIFKAFTQDERTEAQIAQSLNDRGLLTDLARQWTRGNVHQLLTNPKYAGMNVYNRKSFKLKKRRIANPPGMWIRKEAAFEAVIAPEVFNRAQQIIQARSKHYTDDEMLEQLRNLFTRYGTLSGVLIDESEGMPSSSAYRSRFSSLARAYTLVGFTPERDFAFIEINRKLREAHAEHCEMLVTRLRDIGASVRQDPITELFIVNEEFSLSMIMARCQQTASGSMRWNLRFDTSLRPDVTIAVRLEPDNQSVRDYYMFPGTDLFTKRLRLSRENGILIDLFRFDDLKFLEGMAERTWIERAA
jgi:DNA invertase Pin-like site-specific DNA recombinase